MVWRENSHHRERVVVIANNANNEVQRGAERGLVHLAHRFAGARFAHRLPQKNQTLVSEPDPGPCSFCSSEQGGQLPVT